MLDGLVRTLQSAITEVNTVETGSGALRELASEPYNLCFLDIPDVDGLEVLNEINAISPWTKVVIMTGGVVTRSMRECIERKAYMFLTKPFDLFQVRMAVKSLIEEVAA